ncbi:MAG: cytoplasmic protein [Proteobacteria bacterium]|nr:cytoplasmic protein [Pseudomonadota bacterium]
MKNIILIKKLNKILIPKGQKVKEDKELHIEYLILNLNYLGYDLSLDAIDMLRYLTKDDLITWGVYLCNSISNELGADKKYDTLFINFPYQVENTSKVVLKIINKTHYIAAMMGFNFSLKLLKKKRATLNENTKLKLLDQASEDEYISLMQKMINSCTAYSEETKIYIKWFINNYQGNILKLIPESLINKENKAYLLSFLVDDPDHKDYIKDNLNTATDILRFITAISDGDISLSSNTKFKNLSRSYRRLVLELLENISNPLEDMKRYSKKWIRIAERVHPFEYQSKYPGACKNFKAIIENHKIETFNSQLEQYISESKYKELVILLKKRPGEFARKLDLLLRNCQDPDYILKEFESVVVDVSRVVLLQLYGHFKNRNVEQSNRLFFPKGNEARLFVKENDLKSINQEICQQVIEIIKKKLVKDYSEKESLGSVYISKELKKYKVPFALRSASKSLKTYARGSKLDFNNQQTLRLFLWWKEGIVDGSQTGTVDIDLSGTIYSENWEYLEHISYTNLKSSEFKSFHSGDIVTAPKGACEFIDFDCNNIRENGGRFIVISVYSYSRHDFCDIPECYTGWMVRKEPNSGEVFEPKTVENKIDLATKSRISMPIIFDVKTGDAIWTDLSVKDNETVLNNIEGNFTKTTALANAMLNVKTISLHDLFNLHIKARSTEVVLNKDEADTIFDVKDGITPDNYVKILSEFV